MCYSYPDEKGLEQKQVWTASMNGNSSETQVFANIAHRINLVFIKLLAPVVDTILFVILVGLFETWRLLSIRAWQSPKLSMIWKYLWNNTSKPLPTYTCFPETWVYKDLPGIPLVLMVGRVGKGEKEGNMNKTLKNSRMTTSKSWSELILLTSERLSLNLKLCNDESWVSTCTGIRKKCEIARI